MKRDSLSLLYIIGLILMLLACSCSNPNSSAPEFGRVHQTAYLLVHSDDAVNDLNSCRACHQSDFSGSADIPSCFSCHSQGPPFTRHPLPYRAGVDHGPAALNSQKACIGCHGQVPNIFDGGIVGDPELFNAPAGDCSAASCHPYASAHPTQWQGNNDNGADGYASSHRSVGQRSVEEGCVLCHQVEAGGQTPNLRSPSCFASSFTNADGTTSGCHAGGPGTNAHDLPYKDAKDHGSAAKANLSACQECHGVPGSTSFNGGSAATACSSVDCHPPAGAHPTRWQGSNDNTDSYLSTHRNAGNQTVTCAICHDVINGRTPPKPSAPSCFSSSFTNTDSVASGCHASGPAIVHTLPFVDPSLHGPEAKADLSMCLPCHAEPSTAGPGDNPRFNVSIGSLSNGCEDCHAQNTAHPTPLWTGPAATSHKTSSSMNTACTLCHGINLEGSSIARACTDCHEAGSPLVLKDCTSCHNSPPNGAAPAGNRFPNRAGGHVGHQNLSGVNDNCSVCHDGAGTETAMHFDAGEPATINIGTAYNAKSGAANFDSANNSCGNIRCHGGQSTPDWSTGTIDVNLDCLSCHARGTSQYNSYNSGEHRKHLEDLDSDELLTCTDCHSPTRLVTTHFTNLSSTIFDGDPGDSIRTDRNYDTNTNSGCSVSGCHGSETWD